MKNKIILLALILSVSGCYNEQKLKRILPLLDIKVSTPLHEISANFPFQISVTIENKDLEKDYSNYDILIGNGEAQKSTLGISAMYEVANNEWEVIYFTNEAGEELEVLTQEIKIIPLGEQITIDNEFIFNQPGTYKFIFYADYYDEVKERDETGLEKKNRIQENIIIKIGCKSTKINTKKIVITKLD